MKLWTVFDVFCCGFYTAFAMAHVAAGKLGDALLYAAIVLAFAVFAYFRIRKDRGTRRPQ